MNSRKYSMRIRKARDLLKKITKRRIRIHDSAPLRLKKKSKNHYNANKMIKGVLNEHFSLPFQRIFDMIILSKNVFNGYRTTKFNAGSGTDTINKLVTS